MTAAIRAALPDDYSLFAELFLELGTGDPVLPRERWLAVIAPSMLVAEEGGACGYAYVEVLSAAGYVRHVVVAPRARGKGVGHRLMTAVAERFRAAGCSRWCLNVRLDNVPAIRLYERAGMKHAYASTALRLSWSAIRTLPRSEAVETLLLDPSDDEAFERAFALESGQLARGRTKGRVIVGLRDGDALAGVANFDPALPGAFPFRVTHPKLAGDLFAAIEPHTAAGADAMTVVVENDAPLKELLITSAEATVRFELAHFEGELPPP